MILYRYTFVRIHRFTISRRQLHSPYRFNIATENKHLKKLKSKEKLHFWRAKRGGKSHQTWKCQKVNVSRSVWFLYFRFRRSVSLVPRETSGKVTVETSPWRRCSQCSFVPFPLCLSLSSRWRVGAAERAAGEIIRSKTQPHNTRGSEITPSRYRGKFKVNDTLLFFKSYRRWACNRESGSRESTRKSRVCRRRRRLPSVPEFNDADTTHLTAECIQQSSSMVLLLLRL